MILNELLREIGAGCAFGDAEVAAVTDKPEDVVPGSLFVAVEGGRFDGHSAVNDALSRGAVAAVTQRSLGTCREIVVPDTRRALSCLCAAFYGHPDRALRLIGVTGTNGKTSTAEYLKTVLERTGRRCGVIGTLGCGIADERDDSGYTTPESGAFFAALRRMADAGCGYCVAEVSSQALSQSRADAARFALGVLTNVGTDHLDYHGSFSVYVEAKSRLFRLSDRALLNADDAYCEQIAAQAGLTEYDTYSVRGCYADYMMKNIRRRGETAEFIIAGLRETADMRIPAACDFTLSNVLAAVAAAAVLGVRIEEAARALSELPPIKGRMQKISSAGVTAYVDFAHTPEALSGALRGLKRLARGRLIAVFGCGGDRDPGKRPEMGRIAAAYADVVIVTSDNPRGEDPLHIIEDILAGVKNKGAVFAQPDREKAIALAVNKAVPGDIILIAGKGHEEYQLAAGRKTAFSDADVVRKLLCAET